MAPTEDGDIIDDFSMPSLDDARAPLDVIEPAAAEPPGEEPEPADEPQPEREPALGTIARSPSNGSS